MNKKSLLQCTEAGQVQVGLGPQLRQLTVTPIKLVFMYIIDYIIYTHMYIYIYIFFNVKIAYNEILSSITVKFSYLQISLKS